MPDDNINNSRLVPAICTQCASAIEVDPSQDIAVCKYCGTSFIVEKATNNFNVQNVKFEHVESMNVYNNKRGSVESVLNFIEKQQEKKQNKIDEEKRRLEEEKRKQEEQKQKIMDQILNKNYRKRNLWIFGIILIMILMLRFMGATSEKSHEGEARTPGGLSSQQGKDYKEVVSDFEESGFVNIKTEALEDLLFGWLTKDGEVESVSVGGDEDFTANGWYPNDVEVIITYHTFPKKESDDGSKEEETQITEEKILSEEPESTEINKPNVELESTEVSQAVTESKVVVEITEESYSEINELIYQDLLLSQGWALGTLDPDGNPTNTGTPSPVFAFSLYIEDITYLGDTLRVSVFPDFEQLSDIDKTYVINTVQNMSKVHTNDIPYTSILINGDIVGHSKITNPKAFNWD